MRPILLGVLSSFFFAVTFVLNRMMELNGGSWLWSASLRYLFMAPFLLAVVIGRGNLAPLLRLMKQDLSRWVLWSTVGFGLFYAPLCISAAYSPGWLVAGTWQVTIVSGSLLAPLFWQSPEAGGAPVRGRIPRKGLAISLVILAGILLLQANHARSLSAAEVLGGILPVLVASFAYPLGNRKMMALVDGRLDVFQRVLGMTLASLPFWLVLAVAGLATAGVPGPGQVAQSLIIALSAGVVATGLFFQATDLVRQDPARLAAVEATQSTEVLFALLFEVLLLSAPLPGSIAWAGIGIIVIGMIWHSAAHASA